jgi:hypothetical protein
MLTKSEILNRTTVSRMQMNTLILERDVADQLGDEEVSNILQAFIDRAAKDYQEASNMFMTVYFQ